MLRRFAIAAICLAGLAACEANIADYDYRERYPIKVEERTALLILDPGPGGSVMSQDLGAIDEFSLDYGKRAAGTITVEIGANSRTDPLATNFGRQIVDILGARGIPRSHITFKYDTDPAAAKYGRAIMQFPIYVAIAHECGTFKDQPGFTPLNENTGGFGCANQRNLAAMVVNPRDLIDMQSPTGRLAARSDVVVGKYIAGVKIGAGPPGEAPALSTQSTTGGL
ncbi:pilus biogenesis lipoprotein CpaD [Dongia mobilis]|uniref:Pilus biogenesis lipoprotein CpaD n=1 Tax=Dongia mobilis TaxID=578943 RepID=A0A4R6WFZ8_9PROT|nr:CpaD family pilus assembly lipoprotein [Dongia mobilis]TDQ78950.1 pilus biogenesis lipoprotein CpaD [Dongia mobilis]